VPEKEAGPNEKDPELQPGKDADYGIFGVRAKRDEHPVRPPPVDRQRIYTGLGTAGMGTTPRFKNTGGGSVNKASGRTFKVRKRTLKG
jgi:hypothetical protein